MNDEYYMKIALKQARQCINGGDVPVGAVIVYDGKIVAKAFNKKELKNSTCAHAEILAINKANKLLGTNLSGATIYTTKEPCLMCMGAILRDRKSVV